MNGWSLASAAVGGALIGILLSVFAPSQAESKADASTWTLPSCPRELTLQDGSRWAMPAWAEPGCRAVIGWDVSSVPAKQVK
jgi:hypothetical protein